MKEQLKMVAEFHKMTGNPVRDELYPTSLGLRFLRAHLVVEEAAELAKWLYLNDTVEIADAICDSIYVLLGTALALGLAPKLEALFAEVHRSNMTKDASPDSTTSENPLGNRVLRKGPNYRAPQLAEILWPLHVTDDDLDALRRVREAAEHL